MISNVDEVLHQYLTDRLKAEGGDKQVKQFWIGLKMIINGELVDGRWISGQPLHFR